MMDRPSPSASAREAKLCLRSCGRTSGRPTSVRTSRQKSVMSDRWSKFPQYEGKTHALFLGSRSRTSRAADDSQTVRGPLLLSRRKSLPSR